MSRSMILAVTGGVWNCMAGMSIGAGCTGICTLTGGKPGPKELAGMLIVVGPGVMVLAGIPICSEGNVKVGS